MSAESAGSAMSAIRLLREVVRGKDNEEGGIQEGSLYLRKCWC